MDSTLLSYDIILVLTSERKKDTLGSGKVGAKQIKIPSQKNCIFIMASNSSICVCVCVFP